MTVMLEYSAIVHPDYDEVDEIWKLIRDVLGGKKYIDEEEETYVPNPGERDADEYAAYLKRACWYNATARTLEGYVGAIFRKDLEVEVPQEIEYLLEDTDGEGSTITQFSKKSAKDVVGLGRYGLLVDFPVADNVKTLAEEQKLNLRPHILGFSPESIVNWREERRGARTILTQVLIRETYETVGYHVFDRHFGTRYRLLELDKDGFYVIRVLEQTTTKNEKGIEIPVYAQKEEELKPTLPGGKRLDFIPFLVVGSEDSTIKIDRPPLYDLAQLNISHYINSAELEDAAAVIGQPTTWINGVDPTFIQENYGKLKYGSRVTWLLPPESEAGMIESKSEKNLILKLLEKKEEEMIGLGARIVADTTVRGSEATESVKLRRSGEASVLASITDNISSAMKKVLEWAALWKGVENPEIKFKLNKDFFSARLSHQDISALVSAWQSGAISQSVMLDNLRNGEIISETKSNEDVINEIEEEGPPLETLLPEVEETEPPEDDEVEEDA